MRGLFLPLKACTPAGAAVVVLTLLQACLDGDLSPVPNTSNTPYLGPRSACSTGPAFSNDAVLAPGPSQSMQPECVQRCGSHPQLTWAETASVSIEGVPSGACSYDGEACSMVAVKPCCTGGTTGVAYVFECRCNLGTWGCTAGYHGGEACSASCTPVTEVPDAGPPGAGDGGGDGG